jgi:hypothetical protein
MSLYSDEAFKSGKEIVALWKNRDGSEWDWGSSGSSMGMAVAARLGALPLGQVFASV